MEAALQDTFMTRQQTDAPFSYLDKGIDDMEMGRTYTMEEAFQLVRKRLEGGV